MESTAIGGRRGGDDCPRPLFFVPGISPANRSYFARLHRFKNPKTAFLLVCLIRRATFRPFAATLQDELLDGQTGARSASEAYRTARQFEAWVA